MITRKIDLDATSRAKLAKTFNVSIQNVSQALNFKRNSALSARIREAAKQMGGQLLELNIEIKKLENAPRTVKVLNSKGEVVKAVVIETQMTL